MIKISSLKLNTEHNDEQLLSAAASKLGLMKGDIKDIKILRRSLEARKRERLSYVYTLLLTAQNEERIKRYLNSKKGRENTKKYSITFIEKEEKYIFPQEDAKKGTKRPVIVGSGPAGLLCAYELSLHGFAPIVLERGCDAKKRAEAVREFWNGQKLDTECNVQFGEGGAGTFSDGKLNTGVNDKYGRSKEVLSLFVRCGAPPLIEYDAMPHIGSDILENMVVAVRKEIIANGGEFKFETRMDKIVKEDNKVKGVILFDGTFIESPAVILAIGHSARDTFKMLYDNGIAMKPKAFAVGVRAEHDQEMININQWGDNYPKRLGSAAYKLTYRTKKGRSVYTFCMCPGGYVVNASSEEGCLAVNGMSLSKRDSGSANSAVIVSVTPDDYKCFEEFDVPYELTGVAFQRDLERKAFLSGNGCIPIQRFLDFKNNTVSDDKCAVNGRHEGFVKGANLKDVLPHYISEAIEEGIESFDKRIKGFAGDDTLLYAVESRTSSPVRIERDERLQSNIKGIFPCGEGAGYAGGIMSAAIDGIKVAEAVAGYLNQLV